jgi:superfamily I DNA/RNA helicase
MLDANDLADLPGWVERVLAYYRGPTVPRGPARGKDVIAALHALIGQPLAIRPVLWSQFRREQDQLLQLTQQQYFILGVLNKRRRALIPGPAGSGKTMLAVEKASRLAQQGFKVLLTCFNRALAEDLQRRIKPHPNLHIEHFHGLCRRLAQQAGIKLGAAETQEFFDHQLPEALMQASDRLNVRYDAIIVDEGQDFQDAWWIPLQMLLTDPDQGILYIFYDDNQRLYSADRAWPVPGPPYPLTSNCRNTQAIHQVLLQFYRGEDLPTVQGPPGRPVRIVEYNPPDDVSTAVAAQLAALTAEGVPPEEIVVLTPLAVEKSGLWTRKPTGPVGLSENWPPPKGRVYWSTFHGFKGLERSVVILAELERWPAGWGNRDALLYVGCSRACNELIVLVPAAAAAELRKLFSERTATAS